MFRDARRKLKRRVGGRVGFGAAALAAAAVLAMPAASLADDRDRGRGGRDRDRGSHRDHSHRDHGHRDHGRSYDRHRGHDHHWGHGHHWGHDHHHHHHHRSSGLSVRIGLPPIVIGSPRPVYVRERVVVREPATRTVIVQQPSYPPPTVIVQEPAPVVISRPAPPTVVVREQYPSVVVAEQTVRSPRVVAPGAGDVVPTELSMSAYRTGETVMLLVSGVNTGGAFSTSLAAGDLRDPSPVVVLNNTPVPGGSAQTESDFTVNMAIRVNQPVSTVTVLVADKVYQVPVVTVQTAP